LPELPVLLDFNLKEKDQKNNLEKILKIRPKILPE
jgi:hypothetical protein